MDERREKFANPLENPAKALPRRLPPREVGVSHRVFTGTPSEMGLPGREAFFCVSLYGTAHLRRFRPRSIPAFRTPEKRRQRQGGASARQAEGPREESQDLQA